MGNITYDFAGRTAVVTGAARGIGLELARAFRAGGADVVLVDFDGDEVVRAADDLGAIGVQADVSSTADAVRVVAEAVARTGRLDILENNAGILRDKMLWKIDDADWDAVLGVHLGGTFRMTRAAVPQFRAQGYGRVVNVTSYTGLHGNIGQANYAAAKAGIIGLTKTSAKELAAFGVSVNAISPNAETRMIASIPPDQRRAVEATIPMRRFAAPSEMAAAVCFLSTEEAGYITGTVLPVDGGLSM